MNMDWLNIDIPYALSKGGEYEANRAKYEHNLQVLERWRDIITEYPAIGKVIGRSFRYLLSINLYGQDKRISQRSYRRMYGMKHLYFFGSYRFFAFKFRFGDASSWNRNINIFCTLSLVEKVNPNGGKVGRLRNRLHWKMAQKMGIGRKNQFKIRPTNFYIIPLYNEERLEEANKIAQKLVYSRFRKNSFSKIFLIKVFGQDFANKVFRDERYISEFSNYVTEQIAKFILHGIDQYGYTTKKRVIQGVKLVMGKVSPKEYGFGGIMKTIVAREFDRSLNDILNGYGLEYRKANKELKERFGLEAYQTIIYKP